MKNLFEIKTTLLGTAMIVLGGKLILDGDDNYWVIGGLIGLGIAFWFFPDDILKRIRLFLGSVLKKKSTEL